MTFPYTRRLAFLILAMIISAGVLSAQGQPPLAAKIPSTPIPPTSDAREVRQQLSEMFQQFPPSLREVLQRDPTLLTNTGYLGQYPALVSFLAQHPEIAHNPAYFLGTPNEYYPENSPSREIQNIIENVLVAAVFAILIVTLGWLIRGIVNHRRWLRTTKLQTETQNKLLERFTSNEELLTFIQTPAGKRFLESASIPMEVGPRSISAPVGRILWSIQLGVVLLAAGGGLEFASSRFSDVDAATGFQVAGVIAIALGVGFILSAIGSYILSKRLGLFDPATIPSS